MLVELRDEAGDVLAAATSATELQVEETFDDLVSVRDAVIEGFESCRPMACIRLYSRPEEVETSTVLCGGAEPITAGFRGAAAGTD